MSDHKDERQQREEVKSNLRKFLKKRWFYPAVYLCAAALIMTGVLWLQSSHSNNQAKKENKNDVVYQQNKQASPVNGSKEVFKWPVADKNAVEVVQPFYDVKGTEAQQQAALVNYDHTYVQNTGINIGAKDGQLFTARASMSGKVVEAKKDGILGYVVELKHSNGVETLYESLASVSVEPGETVSQGDKLGTAGTSAFFKKAGVNVHFEIRKNGVPVDPVAYFSKGVSDLKDVTKSTESTSAEKQTKEKTDDSNLNEQKAPGSSSDSGNEAPENSNQKGTDNKGKTDQKSKGNQDSLNQDNANS